MIWSLLSVSMAGAQDGACPDVPQITDGFEGPMAHVRYLADDGLEGREVATAGERCAGEYLSGRFEAFGLAPAGDDHSYFQVWDVRVGSQLGPDNRLRMGPGGPARVAAKFSAALVVGRDWTPLGYSASGSVRGALATIPEVADRTAAHALEGKLLVIEAGADLHRIASEAARLGAGGVISLLGAGEPLPALDRERRAALPVPVIAVGSARAEAVRAAAEAGLTMELTVGVEPLRAAARNVAASIPGTAGTETLIVGAHYDHLGRGGEGSLSPDDLGTVHNGADDNASGTAVLLEVARRLAEGPPLAHTVLFLAFTGEERGLWGSARYVDAPLLPLESTAAMLNMDMVGRVTDGKLTVFGTGTAAEWPELLERTNPGPLSLQLVTDGFGSSDHSSFYAKGVPVLHFFSNTHPEYHRAEDDWALINAEGLDQVADLVTAVVRDLAGASHRVALSPIEGEGNPHAGPGAESAEGESARSGFSVRLGTIPDYSHESGGMRITGVRDDSPAAKAGLRGGDVIVQFGDREVEDVYGYMYALQAHEPGDVVEIVVLRNDERVSVTVTLEAGG